MALKQSTMPPLGAKPPAFSPPGFSVAGALLVVVLRTINWKPGSEPDCFA